MWIILLEMFHLEKRPDKTLFDSHQRETMLVWKCEYCQKCFTKKRYPENSPWLSRTTETMNVNIVGNVSQRRVALQLIK